TAGSATAATPARTSTPTPFTVRSQSQMAAQRQALLVAEGEVAQQGLQAAAAEVVGAGLERRLAAQFVVRRLCPGDPVVRCIRGGGYAGRGRDGRVEMIGEPMQHERPVRLVEQ